MSHNHGGCADCDTIERCTLSAATVVGARIRRRRLELGITLETLAEQWAFHPSSLARIERGGSLPSVTTIIKLSAALNTHPGSFLHDVSPEMLNTTKIAPQQNTGFAARAHCCRTHTGANSQTAQHP